MSRKRKASTARPIEVIDCETDPFLYGRVPEPFLWGWSDGSMYKDFTDTKDLAAFIGRRNAIIYAHNGGKFDFHFLFPYFTPGTEVLIINGRVAKATIGLCELRDSYCILPVPLADYNKTKIDYAKFEREVRHLHMKEIQAYLRDDCTYLHELVSQFVATYGGAITLASAAMKYWKGMGHEIPISDKEYYDHYSQWYAGGRVQCFETGIVKTPFHLVDINSAYPFAMMQEHPYSTTFDVVKRPSMVPGKIKGASLYRVVAISQGCLPERDNKGALIFTDDGEAREYRCTGWELKAGLETKTVKVLESIERIDFHETQDFRGYVRHFYELKRNSAKGTPAYLFAKLFMNSLYGKWCADPGNYQNYAIVCPSQKPSYTDEGGKRTNETIGKLTGPWAWKGSLGPWALLTNSGICVNEDGEDEKNRSDYYNVATGASVTGFVRAYLWRHLCAIQKGGGRPIYCDTDSIAFVWPSKKKIPFGLSKELGDWTCEGRFDWGAIGGKKLYAFHADEKTARETKEEWKTACKGVQLEPEEIVEVAKGAEVTYKRDAPSIRVGSKGSMVTFVERRVKATGNGKTSKGKQ